MIAKAKAVAHGIRAMLYVSGESRNKKHPERITRICDNFMPQGMDATGIFTEMKFATMNHPNIRNNAIRIEISPAMEHTEDFTLDDWRELWKDFAAARTPLVCFNHLASAYNAVNAGNGVSI